ncbi:MAG: twin-arginine translocase subunit TatC [Planctomycetota bacterium]
MPGPKDQTDLFDDATMSFGDHLEELRVRLVRGLAGLLIGVVFGLVFGKQVIEFIRGPIDTALDRYVAGEDIDAGDIDFLGSIFGPGESESGSAELADGPAEAESVEAEAAETDVAITLRLDRAALSDAFAGGDGPVEVDAVISARDALAIGKFRPISPVTLGVEEAFFIYLKISIVVGLILSSPWLIYQLWLFVAAGLYPHERKYVHIYAPLSGVLFLGGTAFCFFAVMPFVLQFMLGFNRLVGTEPQIQLKNYINLVTTMPPMFGISFQLPLVMMLLDRIGVVTETTFKERRRMAMLIIAVLSMVLTPSDPVSMLLMMAPLVLLYELGLLLCRLSPGTENPFAGEE